jgi:uncharacterized protein (TIGR04255 family)
LALGPGTLQAAQAPPVWRFSDPSHTWVVSVAVDFVALEVASSTHFADFRDRLEHIIAVIEKTVHPARSKRIGLRKLNELTRPSVSEPKDWEPLLEEKLLGLITAGLSGTIAMGLQEFRFTDDSEDTFIVRHGVVPDPEKKASYVLDLDYFTTRPFAISPQSGLTGLLQSFSDAETTLFKWCLKSPMKEFLGPKPRPTRG